MDYTESIIPGGHFTWGEFLWLHDWSEYAEPTAQQIENAKVLFGHLEPLREQLGRPLEICSGLRTPAYVTYLRQHGIPAALNGPHNEGCAVDLVCPMMRTADLWDFFNRNWPGRLENYPYTKTWVHADIWQWGKHERFNP